MEGQGKKDLKEIRERLQFFLNNNLKAFITDNEDNYYFCFVKDVNEALTKVYNFAGKRQGKTEDILLIDIKEVKLYKDKI